VFCLDWIFVNRNQLGFRLTVCERNIFPTVTFHLNLHGFLESLLRCLIGVFVLLMVISIRLHHDKGFIRLHLQNLSTFTCVEVLVVCLDWLIYLRLF
jgi:hypothetical protein